MSKERMEALNLKTSIKISDKNFDFELYSIDQGIIQEIKLNNEVFALNNGVKQNNEAIALVDEDPDPDPQPVQEEKVNDLIEEMVNGSSNNQMIKQSDNQMIEQSNKEKIIPVVIPSVESTDKPKTINTIYDEEEIIASPGEYTTTALYKPILDEILKKIKPVFTSGDLSKIILEVYKKIGRKISSGSSYVYSSGYRRYMLDQGMIHVKDEVKRIYEFNEVITVKEKKEIPENTSEVLVIPEKTKKTKSPDNTMLFLNWLEKRDDAFFTLGDVVKDLSLSKDRSLKIVQHQLDIGNIKQISKWEFKKTKNVEEELTIPVKKKPNLSFPTVS